MISVKAKYKLCKNSVIDDEISYRRIFLFFTKQSLAFVGKGRVDIMEVKLKREL